MKDRNNRVLRIVWDGTEYECLPDMRSLMMIEERVLLHTLGSRILQGAEAIPQSHLHWVTYCLLHCAGARMTADDVHQAAMDETLPPDVMVEVAKWVIAEVFGVGPELDDEQQTELELEAGEEPPEGKSGT